MIGQYATINSNNNNYRKNSNMSVTTRKEYKLTEEEFQTLLNASQLVRYMVMNGQPPRSPQENANAAWQRLGEKHGFKWDTVNPSKETNNPRVFTAEVKQNKIK